jgi:hypothetical protein
MHGGHVRACAAGSRAAPSRSVPASRRLAAQQGFGGQPACRQVPTSTTIRMVTIAFVRPLSACGESSHAGSVYFRYLAGQKSRSCWYSPRYWPVGSEVAVGINPLSRLAMQTARAAPPGTGPKASTAQTIFRFAKCRIDSPSSRWKSHGPGRWWADAGVPPRRTPAISRKVTTADRFRVKASSRWERTEPPMGRSRSAAPRGHYPAAGGMSTRRRGRLSASRHRPLCRGTPHRRGIGGATRGR